MSNQKIWSVCQYKMSRQMDILQGNCALIWKELTYSIAKHQHQLTNKNNKINGSRSEDFWIDRFDGKTIRLISEWIDLSIEKEQHNVTKANVINIANMHETVLTAGL
ncbi:hypothetical protein Bhyg_15791 [Pseudolycoriella hygida]|uniref:Uncharacterized protein n=1 Tax=Pseudolycoriella hygida TaxID=35572 RepID=A0A9Q0ML76_9DIPT|nr:hypothetical protein Bhyg_15791 [Pseudolycoriella hygida]